MSEHDLLTRTFLTALERGDDAAMPFYAGPSNKPQTVRVSECLTDLALGECRAALFQACHLAAAGKYEASSKALLHFNALCAKQYADDMAPELEDAA